MTDMEKNPKKYDRKQKKNVDAQLNITTVIGDKEKVRSGEKARLRDIDVLPTSHPFLTS